MTSEKPMIALSGVRSSWLILARKSLLARLASSACVQACAILSSAALRSVMSEYSDTTPPSGIARRRICSARPLSVSRSIMVGTSR